MRCWRFSAWVWWSGVNLSLFCTFSWPACWSLRFRWRFLWWSVWLQLLYRFCFFLVLLWFFLVQLVCVLVRWWFRTVYLLNWLFILYICPLFLRVGFLDQRKWVLAFSFWLWRFRVNFCVVHWCILGWSEDCRFGFVMFLVVIWGVGFMFGVVIFPRFVIRIWIRTIWCYLWVCLRTFCWVLLCLCLLCSVLIQVCWFCWSDRLFVHRRWAVYVFPPTMTWVCLLLYGSLRSWSVIFFLCLFARGVLFRSFRFVWWVLPWTYLSRRWVIWLRVVCRVYFDVISCFRLLDCCFALLDLKYETVVSRCVVWVALFLFILLRGRCWLCGWWISSAILYLGVILSFCEEWLSLRSFLASFVSTGQLLFRTISLFLGAFDWFFLPGDRKISSRVRRSCWFFSCIAKVWFCSLFRESVGVFWGLICFWLVFIIVFCRCWPFGWVPSRSFWEWLSAAVQPFLRFSVLFLPGAVALFFRILRCDRTLLRLIDGLVWGWVLPARNSSRAVPSFLANFAWFECLIFPFLWGLTQFVCFVS